MTKKPLTIKLFVMYAVSQKLIHQKFHTKFVQILILSFGDQEDQEDGKQETKSSNYLSFQ